MASLFAPPAQAPAPTPAPTPEPVKAIPIKDDAKSRIANRKAIAARKQSGGRQSTILTSADKLGG